ncbi:protoporphyrinogen/coproporphyrinogen oxidase [Microbacterium sp. No. 7]|uniref:protoporphyrinogen/coproporphyrinogen oxidase n=1 Tax=Microbacterium sp. No. 7 TaxID=1714373 RepID=UPI003FA544EA
MSQTEDLVERARRTRIVVIGGGIAGLVAAHECARFGFGVTLVEQRAELGGGIAAAELDGLTVDVGAMELSPGLAPLIDELGLSAQVEDALPGARWVAGPAGAGPLPEQELLGIPANPWAPEVRRLIGWRGAWRAFVDRLRPPLTIGHERRLATLVRTRMGERVVERLVAPVSVGVFGIHPDRVDVDIAAPGLNQALTRVGSLAGAVAHELPERPAPRRTLTGGMGALVAALRERLDDLAADVRTEAPADGIARTPAGWAVTVAGETIAADAVIVATGEPAARRLLAGHVPALDGPGISPAPVDSVTLVVDAPALDAAPRGHAVYPVPGAATALAVTHLTATWAWLARAAGPRRHVVRVDLPASEADPVRLAAREAETLLGVPLGPVRAAHVEPRERALPGSVVDSPAPALRSAVGALPGLAIAGAWVTGSGLAAAAGGAVAEAGRLRHALLWGDEPDGDDD